MEPKDIKITIPKGYEIDMEKSTFERIVFKKKKVINCWEDLEKVSGYGITTESNIAHWSKLNTIEDNRNVFLKEEHAKSALAMAQISQLLPYYDGNVDWHKVTDKYCLVRVGNTIRIETWQTTYHFLAFNSRKEAERFLKYNDQLIKDYFML